MAYLDIETNFEDAAKIFLGSATGLPAASFFASLDQDSFVSPRLSIRAELGSAEDPPTVVAGGVLEYTQYNLSLSVSVISDASINGTPSSHRSYREAVRSAMLLSADNWTTLDEGSPILPYYEVKYMRPVGTSFEVDGDLAISTLTYEIKFTIKASYFTAPAAPIQQAQFSSTANSSTCATSVSSSCSSLNTYTFATSASSSTGFGTSISYNPGSQGGVSSTYSESATSEYHS